MQGLLSDLPLLGVLELIHTSRQTGVLEVEGEVPYTVAFRQGEIVAGGILDWLGTEALQCCPILSSRGHFEFVPREVAGTPLGPYEHFITEWARVGDEWEEACAYIVSPSRLFTGKVPLFNELGGRSIRAAARMSNRPLLEVAQFVSQVVRSRELQPLNRYAWFSLLLQPDPHLAEQHPVGALIDGQLNLGEIVSAGHDIDEVRDYLLLALGQGLRFQGSGWVLRDLVWEKRFT
ncbi:DUF4388 domain-containing protein [Deinococcus sp.]|uniref:DUF4388 domain-containing protein n=1 Tax=Deinococcus sp. TaxID=47478 RepID=UPI0025B8D2F0|nr:DUF4388 domain-containing protein [Deinococcus sp.]